MMIYGLYAIPSCKIIDTFYYREEVLKYVQVDEPTAKYGHPSIGGQDNQDVIYVINVNTGEAEERFYVAHGEDWYFAILHHKDKYLQGHGVND